MKDNEKQIEEMAKDIEERIVFGWRKELYIGSAENMYKIGYRKLPKDSVVLTRELYNEMVDDVKMSKEKLARIIDNAKEKGSKETAEKIFNQIIWYAVKRIGQTSNDSYYQISFDRLNELAKQFGVEIKE